MTAYETEQCASCKSKEPAEGGWCYMFRSRPEGHCFQWRPLKTLFPLPIKLKDEAL